MAASPPLKLDITIGDTCMSGTVKPNSFVKVVIRDAGGTQKDREAATFDTTGAWSACVGIFSDPIGDKIKLLNFVTGQTLSYIVPRVTLAVHRTTDIVSGKAPAGMKLTIEAADSSGPFFGPDPYDIIKKVKANGAGAYAHNFGADGVAIMAAAFVEVRGSAQGGNVYLRRDMYVPRVGFLVGSSLFQGYIAPYPHLGITLSNGSSTVATGDAVGDEFGQFSGRFIDGNASCTASKGGRVARCSGARRELADTLS